MRLEIDEDGNAWFRDLTPVCAETLLELPGTLECDDPRVQERLLPETYRDPEEEEQWRRFGASDLAHLFATRVEIVRKDLESLVQIGAFAYELRIRREHKGAWLSALNAARLTLFVLHGLSAKHMEVEPGSVGDFEKDLALLRIHLMAYMQELLIEAQ